MFGLLSKRLEDGFYLGESGFILDGFPRSPIQAVSLNLTFFGMNSGTVYSSVKSNLLDYLNSCLLNCAIIYLVPETVMS